MRLRARSAFRGLLPGALFLAALPAGAITLEEARTNAIAWLENPSRQNPDGSWGSGELKPLVTAEALFALAAAGRAQAIPAQRAIAWLRNQELRSTDYRARALRGLRRAGQDISQEGLQLFSEASGTGWGPVGGRSPSSIDTALGLDGMRRAGFVPGGALMPAFLATVFDAQRVGVDAGWSGDGVDDGSLSARVITSEVLRGLALYRLEGRLVDSAQPPAYNHQSDYDLGLQLIRSVNAPVDDQTETLELAARLSALHSVGVEDDGLDVELLRPTRFNAEGVWRDDPQGNADPYVVAIGLLAVTTRPDATFPDGPTDDADGDQVDNQDDAFPYDDSETADTDGDGYGDNQDPDIDGDGVPNDLDDFPADPTAWRDSDGDGTTPDHREDGGDGDGDGVSDADELLAGTDPTLADTDGDGFSDAPGDDPCPLGADETDDDGDGICTPLDACDDDPTDFRDLNSDGECDASDDDDDGDGFLDALEVALGSDPRNAGSVPTDLATLEPTADPDGDGIPNAEEDGQGTNPLTADSDGDGATDPVELAAGTSPTDPAVRPPPTMATFSAMSTADLPVGATSPAGLVGSVTGGQATPVANAQAGSPPSAGPGVVNLAGFQAQTLAGRDLDGDALNGLAEAEAGANPLLVDTDGDGFADGPGGVVDVVEIPNAWDLDGDLAADGEADFGTSPADPDDRPGKPGDVAPLGHPDGRIRAGDAAVMLRLVADEDGVLAGLQGQNRQIVEEAMETDGWPGVNAGDALHVLQGARDGEN